MTQEEQRKEFEQALHEAWERYHCHGWLVDQFEDNYGECAFAKGFHEGSRWMLDNPSGGALLHVLNKGCMQGYKDAVEKAYRWLLEQMFELNEGGEIYVADCDASSIENVIQNLEARIKAKEAQP